MQSLFDYIVLLSYLFFVYLSCYLSQNKFLCIFMQLEAIESGHLPGDILEDIPCKYVDGTLVCEVRFLVQKSNYNSLRFIISWVVLSSICIHHLMNRELLFVCRVLRDANRPRFFLRNTSSLCHKMRSWSAIVKASNIRFGLWIRKSIFQLSFNLAFYSCIFLICFGYAFVKPVVLSETTRSAYTPPSSYPIYGVILGIMFM